METIRSERQLSERIFLDCKNNLKYYQKLFDNSRVRCYNEERKSNCFEIAKRGINYDACNAFALCGYEEGKGLG